MIIPDEEFENKLDNYFDKWWSEGEMPKDNLEKTIIGMAIVYGIGYFIFWAAVIYGIIKVANHYG